MNWTALNSISQIEDLKRQSFETPCLIFKHSTTCEISAIAKYRLESNWDFSASEMEPFYLDLKQFRSVSNFLAEHFEVHHESPQVLLIQDGECVYDESHLDISIEELREAIVVAA